MKKETHKVIKHTGKTLLVCALLSVSACADYTNQKVMNHADLEVTDPNEDFNRAMFGVNRGLDTVLIRPVTSGYRAIVPEGGRKSVSNFVYNLSSPGIFLNSVLQGDQENAFATFWRFVINTTVGIGGLFDVASEAGLKNRPADFGQTLAQYGVGSGPYTMVPILGPGTLRDSFGRIVDLFTNPTMYMDPIWWSVAQAGITAVDKRSQNYKLLDDLYENSVDPYATMRSGYMQKRVAELRKLGIDLSELAPVIEAQEGKDVVAKKKRKKKPAAAVAPAPVKEEVR